MIEDYILNNSDLNFMADFGFNDFSIIETARSCAEGENIEECWLSLLSRILNHWKVDVKMELGEAILLCISATNIGCSHNSPLQITFFEAELNNCLQYPIYIEWEKYDGFLDFWKQNI